MSTAVKENKMGVMPENKLLLSMSIPMMLSMLIQALYNIVDGLYVAGISVEQYEYNAINLAFPAQNLMIAVAVGAGVGINALISRYLGLGQKDRANKIAGQGAFIAICSYFLFALLGIFATRPYLNLMAKDILDPVAKSANIEYGVSYLQICFIGSFGFFCQVICEKYMQSTGKTTLSMTTQLVGAVANIILDPILIYGVTGIIPALGIEGAAYATITGQIISALVGIYLQKKHNTEIEIKLEHIKPDGKMIVDIFKIGLPSILMNSIGSFMTASFNLIIQPLDVNAVKVFGTYFKLQSFVFMPVFGFNNGMISIVSYNYGARKKKRMLRTIKLGLIYAVSMMLVGFAGFQIFPRELLLMFKMTDSIISSVGAPALQTISISFIFAGFSIICAAVFQALGFSIFAMLVSIGRQLITLLPVAYFLALTGDINAVWWSYPIAEVVCMVLSIAFYLYIYKQKIKTIPDEV